MNLKEYIDKYGVKQSVLARRAGVCPQTIIRAIRGKYINYQTALKISNATDKKLSPFDVLSAIVENDNGHAPEKKKKKKKASETE